MELQDVSEPEALRLHVVSKTFWAASTARSTSLAVPSETFVTSSPDVGLKTLEREGDPMR